MRNRFDGLPERALCRAHQSRFGCTYQGSAGAVVGAAAADEATGTAVDEATGTAVGAGAHDGAGAPLCAHDGAPWDAPAAAAPGTREIGARHGAPSEAALPLATPTTAPAGSTDGASVALLRLPFGADASGAVSGAVAPKAEEDAHDKTVEGCRGVGQLEAFTAGAMP
jgi:hypothetical protein